MDLQTAVQLVNTATKYTSAAKLSFSEEVKQEGMHVN